MTLSQKQITKLEEYVVNGIRWLDGNIPNWENRVKVNEFDITIPCYCVLGQLGLWESYYGGEIQVHKFGFDLDRWSIPYDQRRASWEVLQQVWLKELRERQNPSFGNDVY